MSETSREFQRALSTTTRAWLVGSLISGHIFGFGAVANGIANIVGPLRAVREAFSASLGISLVALILSLPWLAVLGTATAWSLGRIGIASPMLLMSLCTLLAALVGLTLEWAQPVIWMQGLGWFAPIYGIALGFFVSRTSNA